MATNREFKVAARKAAAKVKAKIVDATDHALVDAGHAAEKRLERRATIKALKTAGKVALVAGATAATAVAVRAGIRRLRGK